MIIRRNGWQSLVQSIMQLSRSSAPRRRSSKKERRTEIEAVEQRLMLSASDFVINEIHADPADDISGDANGDGTRDTFDDEFVEFVNNGPAQDIGGWTINDGFGLRHTFASPTNVAAGQAVVVFGGGTPTGSFGGAIVVTASSGTLGLNNGGDTVTLSDGTNDVAETYGSEGGRNNSLTRNPDLTGAFVEHDTLNGGTPLFSPGVQNDGVTAFGATPAASVVVTQSGGSTTVTEGGATDTIDVSLNQAPTADVTVTLTPASAEIDLGSGAGAAHVLTFTAANATTVQTVTVAAVDDSDVEGFESLDVTFTTASSDTDFDGLTVAAVSVGVIDNEVNILTAPYTNDFESTAGAAGLGADWTVFSVDAAADSTWEPVTDGGDRLAEVNAFGASAAGNDWLISPAFDLDATSSEVVSFDTWTQFADTGQGDPEVTFLYSTDYSGSGDPTVAAWTSLPYTAPAEDSRTTTASGAIDVSTVTGGQVYFAFQYQSSGTGGSSSSRWRVDDFSITEATTPGVTVTESGGSTATAEGGATDSFTVVLDSAPASDVTITLTPDAQVSLDVTTLTFTPANALTAQTVTVTAVDDSDDEGSHSGLIQFSTASADTAYNNLSISDISVTIADNDGAVSSAGDVVFNEIMQNPSTVADAAGEFFELWNTTGSDIDINGWSIEDDSGATGETHVINNGGPLVITANGFLVLGVNADTGTNGGIDVDYEYSGTNLGNGSDGLVLKSNLGTIIDAVTWDDGSTFPDPNGASMELIPTVSAATAGTANDTGSNWQVSTNTLASGDSATPGAVNSTPAAPTLSIDDVTVDEGAGTAVFTVTLSAPAAVDVTVDFATADDSAAAPGDYTAQSNTLTFTAGETSKTITVAIVDDSDIESTETFNVNLSNPSGANATIDDGQGVGTITDNEVPSISIDDVTVAEDGGTASFTVTLSTASASTVTVDFATSDDSAVAPGDYTALSTMTLTFTPGETTQTITVTIIDDAEQEGAETFHVNLTNPANATIADALGVGTISANDAPSFNPGDVVVNEVMQNPAAVNDADGEYFELWNTTGAAIDINGWSIEDESGAPSETHVIDNGGPLTIPANGFLVLGLNGNTATNGNVPVDYVYSGTSLGNGADGLVIKDGTGTVIDAVTWDGGPNFPDPNGASMELIPTVAAATAGADNDSGANWQVSTTTIAGSTDLGTPGAVNSTPPAPPMFINEIMIDPQEASDTGREFFELRGTPNGLLPADTYLVLLEGDSESNPGNVDHVFTLGGTQFNSSGFLSFTQNAGGWDQAFSSRSTDFENGSVSFLLIQSATAPVVDSDADTNNDGTLDGTGWTIRDGIGNIDGGAADTAYGLINVSGNGNGLVPAGSTFVDIGAQPLQNGLYHPDYVARNGDSTGFTLMDWVFAEADGTSPNYSLAVGATVPSHLGGAPIDHLGATNVFTPPQALFVDITPTSFSENGGTTTARVYRTAADISGPLTVDLSSSDTSEASVPATVTIPADAFFVTFTLSAVDDAVADGTQTVTVTASSGGFASVTDTIDVTDDETSTLTISIDLASMSENGGTATGTVTRNTDTSADLVVDLASNDTSEATVPATVTILAGQTSATFAITAVDDALVDGTQTVTVSASSAGFTDGSDTIDVTDDEVAALTVSIDLASMSESGGTATGTVTRNTDTSADLVVDLASNDTSEATVPATVTILAGQISATFAITAVDDALVDGTQTVTVTASTVGFTGGSDTIDVTDDDVAATGVLINEVDADSTGTDTLEFIELFGNANGVLDGYVLVFFNGSNDLSYSAFDLDGLSLDANGYFVAGNAAVANVGLTFNNNLLQNGADAVALYQADATDFPNGTAITTTSIVDAVVYDTDDADDAGLLALLNGGEPQLNENETGSKDTKSLQRLPNGSGGARNTSSFGIATPTPGTANAADPTITLSIDVASISENGGVATGTLTLSAPAVGDLVVDLSSNDTSEATVPATVTIPDGTTTATFSITGVNDEVVDGTQTVNITASATGFVDSSENIDITDDDTATLTVSIDLASMSENGGTATGTVIRNTDTLADLVVDLSSNDTSEATVPATVTILAGQTSATFAITAVDDALVDGTQTVTVSATSAGFTDGSNTIDLTDDDVVPPTFKLQLLHASDLEGGVDAISRAANFATIIEALEADAAGQGIGSILLSAGDNYIPGPFFNASGDSSLRTPLQQAYQTLFGEAGLNNIREGVGRVDISIMNILGFDAAAVGNHEFDAGPGTFADLIQSDIRGTGLSDIRWLGAEFPYLSSNLTFGNDGGLSSLYTADVLPNTAFQSNLGDLTGTAAQPSLAPATTILVNGEWVGVVGATTQLVESISSTGDTSVVGPNANDMSALAAALQPVIDDVMDGLDNIAGNADDINKVILVSHLQQLSLEQSLIGLLNGVDIVVAGGSDTLLADGNDILRPGDTADAQYPYFTTNADADPAVIVSTDGEYSYVGRLVVEFDMAGTLVAPTGPEGTSDANVSGAYATDDAGVVRVTGATDAATAIAASVKGTEVKKLTDAVSDVVTTKDGIIHGRTGVFLEGRREAVRTEETNMGNLTADANLLAARAVDSTVLVSLKNGGGIRAEIGTIDGFTGETGATGANPASGKLAGEVSQLDIENSLRFNNSLSIVTVTPAELLTILEHGVSATGPGNTPGQFPQVGGLSFSFDPTQAPGSRIGSVAIVDELGNVVDVIKDSSGIVGDPARTIRMVTLSFLADGGDGYPIPATGRVDTGLREQTALAQYLSLNHGTVPYYTADTPVEQDRRIQNLAFRPDTVLSEVATQEIPLTHISTLTGLSGAEISAFDSGSDRVFVTSDGGLEVVDFSDPHNPVQITLIDPASSGTDSSSVTSVAVGSGPSAGIVAIAVPDATITDAGDVLFYRASDLAFLGSVEVGALPDMVTFSPDGTRLLVANEGQSAGSDNEPGVLPNPNGGISIVTLNTSDLSASTVGTFEFTDASITAPALRAKGVRINSNAPSVAADLEPEYITIEGNTAYITLQENNAVAVVNDITTFTGFDIDDILGLGTKDHTLPFNALDASNRDSGIEIRTAPVRGLYMPDAIDSYSVGGSTYFVTANEGDGRGDADAGGDEARVKDYGTTGFPSLDADALLFQADQTADPVLGRIKSSSIDGDTDDDGDIDDIHVFGGRSFSIWDSAGNQVWDSGNFMERFTALSGSFVDGRSDDKGPEPEGVTLASVGGMTFAFVGLERTSDVMVFNVTNPTNVSFVGNIRIAGDISPEGLTFIDAASSPTGNPLLVITNEVSQTLTTIELAPALTLSIDASQIAENGGTATATVTREGDTTSAVAVTISSDDDGSEISHPVTVMIPANQASATFVITGLADSLVDGTQAVTLSTTADGYSSGLASHALLDVTDTDSASVSIAGTQDAREAGLQNGRFVVTSTLASEEDITVNYTVSGTATSGDDFTPLSGSVVISASNTTADIDILILNDGFAEAIESLIITLDSVDSVGSVSIDASGDSDQISVISDDLRSIQVSPSTVTVSEDGTTATFNVTLGAQPASDVVVTVVSSDTGEATVSAATLTFTPLNWNQPQVVTVTGQDDAVADDTQELDITLAVETAASDPAWRFTQDVLIDVLNADNEAPAAVVRLEDVTFFNQDAILEDGLSPEQNGQRSIIKRVQVVLEGEMTITAASVSDGTFNLANLTAGGNVGLVFVSSTIANGRTVVVLSFSAGTSVDSQGSLIDGNYEFSINGASQGFDADNSGSNGGTRSTRFHRLFGDSDGDRDVDAADYGNFFRAFYGDAAYSNAFDQDDDDDLFDEFGAFFSNFGQNLQPF